MEATGGFERRAFLLLWEDGLPCAIVNARRVPITARLARAQMSAMIRLMRTTSHIASCL